MAPTTSPSAGWRCTSCGADIPDAGPLPERCPRCLRSTSLVRQEAASPRRSTTTRGLVVGALLVAGAGASWAVLGDRSAPGAGPGTETSAASPAATPSTPASAAEPSRDTLLSSVPESLRDVGDAITGAVRLAAESLPREAPALVAAVAEARTDGRLPLRLVDEDLEGAPRSASALAQALNGSSRVTSGSLELAVLTAALLRARGMEDVRYGIDDSLPGAATDLQARRYLLQVREGPWLAPDGMKVPEQVTPLDDVGLLANALAWRSLGAMAALDADLASKTIQQARVLAPEDVAIAFLAGQVQVAGGLAEMGLSAMEGAAARRADARTWFVLGVTAMAIDQPFKAHQFLTRSVQADPKWTRPLVVLAQLGLERLELTPAAARDKVRAEIEGHVAKVRALDPDAQGLRAVQAQLAAVDGDLEGAEALLRAETVAHPQDADAWLVLSQFLEASGRSQEAAEVLLAAVEGGLEDVDVYQRVGVMLAIAGRLPPARDHLAKALALAPESVDMRPQLAQLEKLLGNAPAARALLEEHLRQLPEDRQARLLAAQLEMDDGRDEVARKHVASVLLEEPESPDALVLRFLLSLRGAEEAEVKSSQAAAVAAVGGPSELAQILLEQGFFDAGEALLKSTLEADPLDELAAPLLAAVLVARDKKSEAEALRDRIVAGLEEPEVKAATLERFTTAMQEAEDAREAFEAEALESPGAAASPP